MVDDNRYEGEEKIVISFDLGTTQSAVSYAYLYPNAVPEVRMVTKWLGQPDAMGDSKIPSILAYSNGHLVGCGAEARDYIGDDQYQIARWFKLYLHPDSMRVSDLPPEYGSDTPGSINIPPLPQGVTLKQVYSDFLRYLFISTKSYFEDNTPNGSRIWSRLQDGIVIVLATPNGWDTAQQGFLQEAAIEATIVTRATAETNLEFVTEAEASVHYVLAHQQHTWLNAGTSFVVVDAGGSTVDSTLYECRALRPKIVLQEVCASECVQAGGVFVDQAAREILVRKLEGSVFVDNDYIDAMVDSFEKNTKRLFNGTQDSNVLQFGSNRDNDREKDIIKGRISLSRDEIESTFDPVLNRIQDSVSKLVRGRAVQYILLVGGFGESPYLRTRFRNLFRPQRAEVVTVEQPSKKAAAEGASIWYIKQLVAVRVARFTIGGECKTRYNPRLHDHQIRKHRILKSNDGEEWINNSFKPWVEKGTMLDQEFSRVFPYYWSLDTRPTPQDLTGCPMKVFVWEGSGTSSWITSATGGMVPGFRELCSLQLDENAIAPLFRQITKPDGKKAWIFEYRVVLRFGGTRLTAKFQWEERGRVREGRMAVIPNYIY